MDGLPGALRRAVPVRRLWRGRRHVCAGGVALSHLWNRGRADRARLHGCDHGLARMVGLAGAGGGRKLGAAGIRDTVRVGMEIDRGLARPGSVKMTEHEFEHPAESGVSRRGLMAAMAAGAAASAALAAPARAQVLETATAADYVRGTTRW